jgi:hypothetical protein
VQAIIDWTFEGGMTAADLAAVLILLFIAQALALNDCACLIQAALHVLQHLNYNAIRTHFEVGWSVRVTSCADA